jgi:hypothetical protein
MTILMMLFTIAGNTSKEDLLKLVWWGLAILTAVLNLIYV